jgi:hypothetical protein
MRKLSAKAVQSGYKSLCSRGREPTVIMFSMLLPTHLALIDRRTGTPVGAVVPIEATDWPFEVPSREVPLLRYLDWHKFEDLVSNRRLYFRRADRLDDQMEGRFSQANQKFQTALWKRFQEAHSMAFDPELEKRINESFQG